MTEEFKPGARCPLYSKCATYNGGLLRAEAELDLCGRGLPVDKDYVPRIQKVFGPPSKESNPPEMAVCPVYGGYIDSLFTGKVRGILEQFDWFWEGRRSLDEIVNL